MTTRSRSRTRPAPSSAARTSAGARPRSRFVANGIYSGDTYFLFRKEDGPGEPLNIPSLDIHRVVRAEQPLVNVRHNWRKTIPQQRKAMLSDVMPEQGMHSAFALGLVPHGADQDSLDVQRALLDALPRAPDYDPIRIMGILARVYEHDDAVHVCGVDLGLHYARHDGDGVNFNLFADRLDPLLGPSWTDKM